MTPDQAIDHLFQMSREAPRPAPFHESSAAAVQVIRSRLAELEAEVKRLTGLVPVSNVSPE